MSKSTAGLRLRGRRRVEFIESALAGTVNVVNTTSFTPVVMRAANGEFNDLTVAANSTIHQMTFADANVNLTAGKGCSYLATGDVACVNPNASVEVYLGDKPDRVHVIVSSGALVKGGADDDKIADSFAAAFRSTAKAATTRSAPAVRAGRSPTADRATTW